MSSSECLREFVNERLTAAAEEIFRVFNKTIVEYEKEIDRQRRLLDISRKPEIKLHPIDLPQNHVFKEEEEVLTDQQLCNQKKNSSLDQEDPEPPQIKEEQEELCTSQEGEQLVVKLETDTFMLTPAYEESDHRLLSDNSHVVESRNHNEELQQQHVYGEQEVLTDQQLYNQEWNSSLDQEDPEPPQIKEEQEELCTSQEGEQLVVKLKTDTFMLTPPYEESDHQLPSDNSHVVESQDQNEDKHGDWRSTRDTESEPKERHYKISSPSNSVYKPTRTGIQCNIQTGKKPFTCDSCGKECKCKSQLNVHMRTHTGERPYICKSCGKRFTVISALNVHMRTHTGEKPYSCNTCGKHFRICGDLKVHMRTHTGEKPYLCNTCGKRFTVMSTLKRHMRVHTDA